MSKFNQISRGIETTQNHEGGKAYVLDPKIELYTSVVTNMLSDKFYESSSDSLKRIRDLIQKVDPEFVAKLAVYARTQMYLRSIPLVLLVELMKIHSNTSLVSLAISRTINRVDEITELLAYFSMANNRSGNKKLGQLPKQLIRGLKMVFNKFNEYQFAKYNRPTAIKLRDALFLVHPKPKDDEQKKIFDKIASGTLETPYTWEVELSKGGDKKKTWEELIASGKVGYMALLRNLRNIVEADVSIEHINKIASTLSNRDEVLKSKQFPFRFLSAYNQLVNVPSGHVGIILDALENAMIVSAENIVGFDSNTSIALSVDTSGSMQSKASDRSTVSMQDVGLVLGSLLQTRCKNVETTVFGERMEHVNLPKNNILANVATLEKHSGNVGHATNGYLVLEDLLKRGIVKDKIMLFTDCELWDSWDGRSMQSFWNEYKKIAPNAKIYIFNLGGYGTSPLSVKGGDVFLIGGWSDKIFDMLTAYENGSSAIEEVEKIIL